MLDDAIANSANKDAAAEVARKKLEADTKASGLALKEKLMVRLLAAQSAWEGKLKLKIEDNSEKFSTNGHSRTYPSIGVSVTAKAFASYTFETHSPGYVSVR
jgi:hypothetical protein